MRKHMGDWVVLHSDGAQAYPGILAAILQDTPDVYLDQVDHSGHQFTRFHRHTTRGSTSARTRVRVLAGTQLIDGFWKHPRRGALYYIIPRYTVLFYVILY